ncbi:MAG: hypothetical protein IKI21_10685 [Oscillospiraceae bacterium]|nr:hypothetical protein [Oscillospiraceae bacterium]
MPKYNWNENMTRDQDIILEMMVRFGALRGGFENEHLGRWLDNIIEAAKRLIERETADPPKDADALAQYEADRSMLDSFAVLLNDEETYFDLLDTAERVFPGEEVFGKDWSLLYDFARMMHDRFDVGIDLKEL